MRVEILRNVVMLTCPFTNHFKGFEGVGIVKRIFGARTEEVLEKLEVEFTNTVRYMRVDDVDGHLLVNPHYLSNGDLTDIYLDVIHELVHVKQFMEGKTSNKELSYIERPMEIEAYRVAVDEARALGLDEDRIFDYLESELVNDEELKQLAQTLDVNVEGTSN
ncbi:MAG: hypothetical protein WAN82_07400 [Candidatus Bathyarchaeia archaeon]|jgi:hypothetical protein